MEIIALTNNANFARVKLGEIRPNRFRDLARWPVERSVIEGLKQSISQLPRPKGRGLWWLKPQVWVDQPKP